MNIKQIIGGILVLGVLALVVVGVWKTAGSALGGSTYEAIPKWFGNGFSAGLSEQLAVDKDGNATTTGSLSVSGVAEFATFTQGGGCTASSTTANAGTVQAADVDTENCITFTPNVSDVTLTLAASTTEMCPSTTGQVRTFFIRNATTTAGIDVSLAGGTGIALKRASSTAGTLIQGDTDGSNFARLDVIKLATTDCVALTTLYND